MTRRKYHAYEKGRIKPPYDLLCELCLYFNVSADYLCGFAPVERDPSRSMRELIITRAERDAAVAALQRAQENVCQLKELNEKIAEAERRKRFFLLVWLRHQKTGKIKRCKCAAPCPYSRKVNLTGFLKRAFK